MTRIEKQIVLSERQLRRRDNLVAALTVAAIASWSAAWFALPQQDDAEVIPVITGDAVRVARFVCRKNDGIVHISPHSTLPHEPPEVTFHCRDGAQFTDTVLNLK